MDKQKEDDKKEEIEGITFVVENVMVESFSSFDIDYSDHFLRKGFSVSVSGQSGGC